MSKHSNSVESVELSNIHPSDGRGGRAQARPARAWLLWILGLMTLVALSVSSRVVYAASTINVNTTTDENGAGAGCSLREAITTANTNANFGGCTGAAGEPYTINLPAGTYQLTLPVVEDANAGGDLDILALASGIDIEGAGASTTIIQQTIADRVIHFTPGVADPGAFVATIKGVTITGGNSTGSGGGILMGGTGATFHLENCAFTDNHLTGAVASNGGAFAMSAHQFGGAGNMTVKNCTFTNNSTATGVGGAIRVFGGTAATLDVDNSSFDDNQATTNEGGAMFLTTTGTGAFTVTHSIFTNNRALDPNPDTGGGAIQKSNGTLEVHYSRFYKNSANSGGSGAFALKLGGNDDINATNNWWGCNGDPGTPATGCDVAFKVVSVTGNLTVNPRLQLRHLPASSAIPIFTSTMLNADFLVNSANSNIAASNLTALVGVPVAFGNPVKGTITSPQATIQPSGGATATFNANACGSGSAGATVDNATATANITVQCPDLTATKTNNASGSVVTGQPWTWTTTITNSGTTTGTFSTGQSVLTDNLPNSANIGYGSPSSSNGNVSCAINGTKDLSCTASSAVTLATSGATSSFSVQTQATASAVGTYANPRASATCAVDPANSMVESNEANNGCSNSVVVSKANTTASINSDLPDPSVVGQAVTVTYGVSVNAPGAGTPTGNETVSDGTLSCTATVATGQCTITFTSAGLKSLTATYAGDANFNASPASGSAAHTVNKADTTTTMMSVNPDPSVVGQPVTLAYSVTVNAPGSGTPTGNVTVSDGTQSCTGTVAAGTCNITFTTVGNKSLSATYAGDSNFNTSTSAAEAHTVNPANTTTTISSDNPDPSVVGQSVTIAYSVTVNSPGSGIPTGNVTVTDGTISCTATVASGQCLLSFTSAGARSLSATYAGDSNFNGGASGSASHQVNAAATTTTIASDTPDPSQPGQVVTVTFGVVVNAPGVGTPTGNITVSDGVDLCMGTVAAGSCSITLNTQGARTLTATYAGDGNFNVSASASVTHTVSSPTAVTVSEFWAQGETAEDDSRAMPLAALGMLAGGFVVACIWAYKWRRRLQRP